MKACTDNSIRNNENKNTYDYIDKIKEKLFENLRSLPHVPSVQMHDRAADGITVKEHKKGHSEGDPETRLVVLWILLYTSRKIETKFKHFRLFYQICV